MNSDTVYVTKKNHAFLQIDAEPSILTELASYFAFRPEGYQFMPLYRNRIWDGYHRIFDIRTRELPSGLFTYLQEFANARQYELEVQGSDYYGLPNVVETPNLAFVESFPITSKGKKIDYYEEQLIAIHEVLKSKQRLILSPTASGKSLIIYGICRYYLKHHTKDIILIVPTTSLVEQMYKDFTDYSEFDASFDPEATCHLIYSGKSKKTEKRLIITTWQSVYKKPTAWFHRFGAVICDEAHTATGKSISSVMGKLKEADYRIGTTGTIKDAKAHHLQLEGHFGPVFRVTTTKKLMEAKKVSELDINALVLKYSEEVRKKLKKVTYQQEIDFIINHPGRNLFIRNLALDLHGNTLVMFRFTAHGKELHRLIEEKAHETRKVFFVSGATDVASREEVRRITEQEKDAIIVASLGVFSTGINIKNLHNLVFATPSKSQIKVLQSIGRILRLSDDGSITVLYDIIDDIHWKSRKNYAYKHGTERLKIYINEQFDYKLYEVDIT